MTKKIDPTVTHPAYAELARKYELTDDAFTGNVMAYIDRHDGQTSAEFEAYKKRAAYFGVVERTTQAIIGAMTRKPFTLEGMSAFPQTDYHTPDAFLQASIRDLLLGARICILVDIDESGASKLVTYDANDVINWSDDFIIIKECKLVPSDKNPYEQVVVNTWRELYYDDNGKYAARRWVKDKKGFKSEDLPQFQIHGNPVDQIPMFVVTPYDNTWNVYTPPLFVQASLNIDHFKQSLEMSHYRHFMAMPTYTIEGDLQVYDDGQGNQTSAEVKIGSTKEATHLQVGSKMVIVEGNGSSSSFFQSELAAVEERMFISGSRLLSSKKGVESVEALQLRSGSESAVLETITNALESALMAALAICAEIDRSGTNPVLTLNKDFNSSMIDPAMLKSLLDLYVAGVITLDQMTARLTQGEVIDAEA